MTLETNPESGTTTYTYDTDSTCGTSKGDLVKRVDAVGNVICYSYDSLHRQLSRTYPSGSYASATPKKYFVYDSATVNSVAMANVMGRLAEAYTCTGSCTSKITDLGFSYTVRGEISDQYQVSPSSSGYYHAVWQYWPNGALKQLSGLPTLPIFNYGVDSEGRISTLSASTGQSPLTGTTYNSAGLPTALNFGSGDSDAFTYDPNTYRMTKYQFNLNGSSYVGNLGWNANGTLGSLGITDPFNSPDTQNCSYAHDDLVRISSANCGSAASQTFSYDPFGNINKTGTPYAFNAIYNSVTNHISTVGGITPTYDANGNSLNDGAHVYTWDSDGNHATVDGIGLTYDALGRSVEISYPSEILPLPGGSVLFKGQVARAGVFNLPAGTQAIYDSANGGLINYYHPDHLGSIRLASTPTRTLAWSMAYAPFGEPYAQSTVAGGEFTGQGGAFGLDEYDFPAREYSDRGRWVSPDPAGLAAVDPSSPQTWNRYAYVSNSPLNMIDPTGMFQSVPPGCSVWYPVAGGAGSIGCLSQPWLFDTNFYCDYIGVCNNSGGDGGGGGPAPPPPPPPPNNGEPPSACELANIKAVNSVSNLNVSVNNVVGNPFIFNGGLNVNFSVPGASPSSLRPGRYPSSFLDKIFGIGSSLHVPAAGGADPSNYGVDPATGNFTFTTHIDTAYATWHTPIGALIHFLVDVLDRGAHRKPCGGIK